MNLPLEFCKKAAYNGGRSIINFVDPNKEVIKETDIVGHHAIVSGADYKSQDAILRLLEKDRGSFFLTEEIVQDEKLKERIITLDRLKDLESSQVYIIDELDGSSSHKAGHYEWSISVGYVKRLEHLAGAVYAPKIGRGLLFSASNGEGTFLQEGDEIRKTKVTDHTLADKNAYVIFGVDCFLSKYPKHNELVTKVSDKARTTNSNGSCALPLGLIGAGIVDALIQPLQCPWDWAAGKVLVEEAGGKMLFYEMENGGEIIPIKRLRTEHYNPVERKVGFIAGNEKITQEIMNILLDIKK